MTGIRFPFTTLTAASVSTFISIIIFIIISITMIRALSRVACFLGFLQHFPTSTDDHRVGGLSVFASNFFDVSKNSRARDHLSKDNVFLIEVRSRGEEQKELRGVGVWTAVGHAEQPGRGVASSKALICKLPTVDRLASCPITALEVSTLCHEAGHYAVKRAPLVEQLTPRVSASALLPGAQQAEILGRPRTVLGKKLKLHLAHNLGVDLHLQEHCRVVPFIGRSVRILPPSPLTFPASAPASRSLSFISRGWCCRCEGLRYF
mmetsp:Transcript_13452/g.18412  ORF Transcript_13452/g.18412 Transcript_13452/m.18412 type:complete len:263 (-) Transcript_13452:427-1215(-)